jgi:RimJ/RimL family protein N-acetyltransferase
VELGIWIGRRWRARGVGRRAMQELLAQVGGARVIASTTADNTPAQRLMRGLGATLRVTGDEVAGEFPHRSQEAPASSRSGALA